MSVSVQGCEDCRRFASGVCPLHQPSGAAMNMLGVWQMQQRPADRLAREVAMASVVWLASDGNDDAYDAWKSKVEQWKELILDGD